MVKWSRSGPKVTVNGVPVKFYTFGNCLVNLFYAAHGRHGSNRSSPDPVIFN